MWKSGLSMIHRFLVMNFYASGLRTFETFLKQQCVILLKLKIGLVRGVCPVKTLRVDLSGHTHYLNRMDISCTSEITECVYNTT